MNELKLRVMLELLGVLKGLFSDGGLPLRDDQACVPPTGWHLVPQGSATYDMLFWDGTNWVLLAYPTSPNGQHLAAGLNGPFWANP